MRRVELMGPPGVGKSTLFRAALAQRRPQAPEFRSFDEIARRSGAQALRTEFENFVASAYAGLTVADSIHLNRLRVTQRALSRARKIKASLGNGVVLVDEGLCQRGLSIDLSRPGSAARYFELMPKPAAVFVLVAPIETIAARNHARHSSGSGSDRSADAAACIAGCAVAAAQLKARGVPVIVIDAVLPIETGAGVLLGHIRALA